MNTFSTLFWLETRKFGLLTLALWAGVVAWHLIAGRILSLSGNSDQAGAAVAGLSLALALGGSFLFLILQASDFGRDYRSGRWPLLLGAPHGGWQHLFPRVLFALGALGVFNWGLWLVMNFWIARLGLVFPLGFGFKIWLYLLGGLPFIIIFLFVGLLVAAYLPSKANVIVFVVGVLGLGQVLELAVRLLGPYFYRLPAWTLPAPRINSRIDLDMSVFPGLPSELFLLLALLSLGLLLVMHRMWQEVEA